MEVRETYETPEQVLEDMRRGYARFVEGLEEARSTGMMELFSNYLRGDGNPRVNQLVDAFAQVLGGWVEALAAFGQFLAASPWNAAAVLLAMGAAFFALSWLLLRRAMIRPAK